MALVAKSNHLMALPRNQQGQISIFFSASLVVLVSIIAFVINVGLFVKAKINLQNATDAAAYAGAAVQARQLSKIAHLNWEMRNIYKEWMYKYYVVGNLNINDVESADTTGAMSFAMEAGVNPLAPPGERATADLYNVPSVCIHFQGAGTNVCKRYSIPGLPEFGSSSLPGAEEASRAFNDSLIDTKVRNCIDRTQINMYVASSWIYNVLGGTDTFSTQGPAIMADKQGAWPRAVELAMRIRNLEKAVNLESYEGGICINGSGSTEHTNCNRSVDEFSNGNIGNERPVKAFYSGFRNIGGSFEGDEMKNSFTLTELPPDKFSEPSNTNASNFLIPNNKIYPKQYLDLKLMMVNYAIFYTALIPRADKETSAACDVSKAAIPVPGYPLGFYKNPEFLTYYAVKGEAEFIGMFNPFSESVKLTAYSAAKPMGGRIGPMLFTQPPGKDAIYGRQDDRKRRSVPYMSTINVIGTMQKMPTNQGWVPRELEAGEFAPGVTLPVNGESPETQFWLDKEDNPVGGLLSGPEARFGIPNLAYEYSGNDFTDSSYNDREMFIHTIFTDQRQAKDKEIGLYSKSQFKAFKGTIGGSVSAADLDNGIARVKAPTRYEAANYLIPVPFSLFPDLGHFGQISGTPQIMGNGVMVYRNYIYAPLYGEEEHLLYLNAADTVSAIFEFMRLQKSGLDKYRDAMNMAAKAIYDQAAMGSVAAAGAAEGYRSAAAGVSDIEFNLPPAGQIPGSCKSLAGTFLYFYWAGEIGQLAWAPPQDNTCPTPLGDLLQAYFSQGGNPDFRKDHYLMEYSYDESKFANTPSNAGVLSAYMPGPHTGVELSGMFNNLASPPIVSLMRRNFYSTKLIALGSVKATGGFAESTKNFSISSEGDIMHFSEAELTQSEFANPLKTLEDTDSIKH
jgi:uncharacterized protein (UPF0333 family)